MYEVEWSGLRRDINPYLRSFGGHQSLECKPEHPLKSPEMRKAGRSSASSHAESATPLRLVIERRETKKESEKEKPENSKEEERRMEGKGTRSMDGKVTIAPLPIHVIRLVPLWKGRTPGA
jgi:hypothetical protein